MPREGRPVSDVDMLLAAILADPDDLAARHAYADALEERGRGDDAARADYVRRHLDLDRAEVDWRTMTHGAYVWTQPEPPRCRLEILPRMGGVVCKFVRGFVEEVECDRLEQWLECGPAMAKGNPLRRVQARDKTPRYVGGLYGWWREAILPTDRCEHDELPPVVWRRLRKCKELESTWRWYGSAAEAFVALSAACILWAREQP